MNDTNAMYNEIMMDHYMNSEHKKKLEHFTHYSLGVNPSCGDEITLYLEIKDNVIMNASFTGIGCAVSQSSTSIMIDLIINKSIIEAHNIIKEFRNMIYKEDTPNKQLLKDAIAFENISNMPARIKCAELSYKTLEKLLIN